MMTNRVSWCNHSLFTVLVTMDFFEVASTVYFCVCVCVRERGRGREREKLRKALTMYRPSEHNLAIEKARHRQNWLDEEERLCSQCDKQEVESEPTSCPKHQVLRNDHFPNLIKIHPEFESIRDIEKLPYLHGKMMIDDCSNFFSF